LVQAKARRVREHKSIRIGEFILFLASRTVMVPTTLQKVNGWTG